MRRAVDGSLAEIESDDLVVGTERFLDRAAKTPMAFHSSRPARRVVSETTDWTSCSASTDEQRVTRWMSMASKQVRSGILGR